MPLKFNDQIKAAGAVNLDVKASDSGRIEGYASTIGGVPDRHGEIVLAGAFADTMTRYRKTGETPAMLWAHAQEQPIGKWRAMEEDSTGLFVEGALNLNTAKGREAFEHIKAGDAGGLSIGFTTPEGGRQYVGEGVFHLSKVDVLEISVVAIPANPLARITGVKSLSSKSEAVDMLRECGLSKKAAARFAAGGWPALNAEEFQHEKAIKFAATIDAAINRMRQQ